MKICLLLLLVWAATAGTGDAQSLTVTIDGSNLQKPDNVRLLGQEYEIDRVTLARDMPVRPGKTTTQTFPLPADAVEGRGVGRCPERCDPGGVGRCHRGAEK